MGKLKIIFFGTGKFAVAPLDELFKSEYDIVMVVTQPDSKKGRGQKLAYSPIKERCLDLGIKIFQPEDVNCKDSIEFLKKIGADFYVVVSYGQILSEEVLKIPIYTPINIHGSLLPKYRGAAPIERSIMADEEFAGVSIMKMTKNLDSGDVYRSLKIPVDGKGLLEIESLISKNGGRILVEVIRDIINVNITAKPQNEKLKTYAKKISKEEKYIRFNMSSREVDCIIRGLYPRLTPTVILNKKKLGIVKGSSKLCIMEEECGKIVAIDKKLGIGVSCLDGIYFVEELKPEGKRVMDFKSFLNGYKINIGDKFDIVKRGE